MSCLLWAEHPHLILYMTSLPLFPEFLMQMDIIKFVYAGRKNLADKINT